MYTQKEDGKCVKFNRKVFLLIIMLCGLILPKQIVWADETIYTSGDYEYVILENGTAEISDYTGTATTLTIPGTINGKDVTSIGNRAFGDCDSLQQISIPNCITTIGNYAFECCTSLKEITLSENITTINTGLFYDCKELEKVAIPAKVLSIESDAFEGCEALMGIEVDADNLNFCSVDGVLFNKNKSMLLLYPIGKTDISYSIPSYVTSIGEMAFKDCCNLTVVSIPPSVTNIESGIFWGCENLRTVDFFACVNTIEYATFYNCYSLTSIAIPSSVTNIDAISFENCRSLASVTIPSSVTTIGNHAFARCEALANIELPDNLTDIAYGVFAGCFSLNNITIPVNVKSIGGYAFGACSSLETIVIPDGVTTIGESAFEDCTKLISISVPESVTVIEDSAFRGCDNLKLKVYPDSQAEYYARLYGIPFEYPYIGINSMTLNQAMLALNEGDVYTLKATILPAQATNQQVVWSSSDDSVATVSELGVVNALKTGTVTIVATVKNENVTANCEVTVLEKEKESSVAPEQVSVGTQLQVSDMKYEVTSIDQLSVSCVGVSETTRKDVVIPNTISVNGVNYKVTTIVKNAFKGNKTLQSIVIGKEVITIEEQAFYNCKALKKITFKTKKLAMVGKNAFKGVPKKAEYSVPSGKRTLYKRMISSSMKGTVKLSSKGLYQITNTKKKTAAFIRPESDKAKSVTVAATVTIDGKKYKVTVIADNAFKNQKKLTKITIGSNVITIGKDAFTGCKKLKNLAIKSKKIKTVKKSKPGTGSGINFTSPAGTEKKYRKLFSEAFE